MGLEDLNTQVQDMLAQVNNYFSDLNMEEKYGWLAEGLGLILVIAGIVFLFI